MTQGEGVKNPPNFGCSLIKRKDQNHTDCSYIEGGKTKKIHSKKTGMTFKLGPLGLTNLIHHDSKSNKDEIRPD